MNIIVQNRVQTCFELTDLDVHVKRYFQEEGVIYYKIEVKLQGQTWFVVKRFSEFDKLNTRLRNDLESQGTSTSGLPRLPPKKCMYNKKPGFLKARLRGLHNYMKNIILIYEAIENPILQRFLQIDLKYDPYYEYASIEVPMSTHHNYALTGDISKDTHHFSSSNRRNRSADTNLFSRLHQAPAEDFGIELPEIYRQSQNLPTHRIKTSGIQKNRYLGRPQMDVFEEKSIDDRSDGKGQAETEQMYSEHRGPIISILEERKKETPERDPTNPLQIRLPGRKVDAEGVGRYSPNIMQSLLNISDEYENIDEESESTTQIKKLVKKTTECSNRLTREISENYSMMNRVERLESKSNKFLLRSQRINALLKHIVVKIKEFESMP